MTRAKRIIWFLLVGATCFGLQWLVLHELRQQIHPVPADIIGFVLSAQLNFWLSNTITWGDREGTWKRYNFVAFLAALVNASVFWPLHRFGELVALLFAGLVSSVFSYLLVDFYVFPGQGPIPLPESWDMETDLTEIAKDGVAIFMPAHNEAENLPYVVGEAVAYFKSLDVPFAVIVVDDGSTDNTFEVMVTLMSLYPEVRLVQHETNLSYGVALQTGFLSALETGFAWIGFCDSDHQFKPHDFGKLIAEIARYDADTCYGFRIDRADPLKRRLMGRTWHMTSRWILRYQKVIDIDCGFKMFRRAAVNDFADKLMGSNAAISPEMLARAGLANHKVVQVGVKHHPRPRGKQSGAKLSVIVNSYRDIFAVRKSIRQNAPEKELV